MPSWKKVVTSGSNALLNQITASAGISTSGDIDLSGGKLWVGGTNRRVILGPKSDNYEGNRIDIGAGIRLFASGDQHFKGQGVTTTVGRDVGGGVVLLPRHLSVTNNITGSGNLEIAGNISGSSTSTGSFGRVEVEQVNIGATGNNNYPLSVDGDVHVKSGEIRMNNGQAIRFQGGQALEGSTSTKTVELGQHSSFNTVDINDGILIVSSSGLISGSATSTGSFGAIFNPGVHPNQTKLTFPNSTAHFESGYNSGYTAMHGTQITLANSLGNASGYLYANHAAANDYGIQLGAYYGAVGGIQLTAENGAHLYAHMTGSIFEFGSPVTSISGSSTSTGSFGSGYINNTLNVGPNNSTHTGFALDVSGSGHNLLQLKSSDSSRLEFKLGAGMGSGVGYIQKYNASGTEINRFYLGNSTDFYSKGTGGTRFFVSSGDTQALTINNSADVGIGVASPSARLHVQDSEQTSLIVSSSTANGYTMALQSSNGTGAGIVFRSDGGHNRGRIYYDGHMTIDNADDAARSVRLRTGQGTAASGKDVAVIKIAPSGSNSGYFSSHGDVLLGRNHGRADSQQTSDFAMHISSSAKHGLITLQNEQVKIMSETHNTATGTTNHFTTLGYDNSGARPFILSNQSNTPILFKNNAGSIPLAIHTNQYVGVNNTSPGYRLDVLHVGDDQFRVGRSSTKYVAIRDDVMQFTGMTGNGMRIQTSDNSDIKFSAGTGDIIFDYANSGGRVISYADVTVSASLTVTGDIIAENYIVSSSTTYMTTSFSAGSTAFGDTLDDNHDFTGSLNVTGSISIEPNNSDVTATTEASLYLRGPNQGIKMQRFNSTNTGAYAHLYLNGHDWLTVQNNNGNDKGIATDRIGCLTQNPNNNYIHFDGFNKKFYGYHEGQIYEQHDDSGISIMLNADHTFKVSGSLIEFEPTEKVSVTGNLEIDGTLTEASTMRIKTNIETLESPLDKITKLRGVSYNLKKSNEPSIGMIAEEVEQIFPELVSKDEDGKAAAMSYGRMTAVLLEAIKELKDEVDELKQENIYMKRMNRKNK